MDPSVDLKVNRDLLDPNFDGYKLSLDALPTYRVKLTAGIDECKLTDDQYSYQHIKAFAIHNHLTLDQWNPTTVYLTDSNWKLTKVAVNLETQIGSPVCVLDIPEASNQRLVPERHNVTLHFPSPEWAVLADGASKLYIIKTDDRREEHDWKICYSGQPLGDDQCFVLLYSVLHMESETQHMECLLLHVDKVDGDEHRGPGFCTILEWLTFSQDDSGGWRVQRTRRLRSYSTPNYAVLDESGKALYVASDKPIKFVSDSLKPVKEPTTEEENKEADDALPSYTWQQTEDDLTLTFTLAPEVTKADITFHLTENTLDLGIKNGHSLLTGMLHGHVDVQASAWTMQDRVLELTLGKTDGSTWPVVVVGDTRGDMVLDPELVRQIHERLAHLTSENPMADPGEERKQAYNTQGLEECDAFPDEASVMLRLDGDTHAITHQVNLGSHQWIFNSKLEAEKMPCICLRHDVDGLLWQPESDTKPGASPWKHVGTFNAFGYVQASKQQKKFSCCPPDMSYTIICDCVRHIYIYHQPSAILSPLRNRKTGQEVSAIAKQQVVSLEAVDDIVGIQTTNEKLFVLAGNTLYIVTIKSEDV